MWAGSEGIAGFTGRGIGVAVVDTGIATHRDSGSIVVSHDFVEALGREGDDGNGHGTHVSGTINAGAKGGYPGVAPGAHIINLRALNEDGSGFTSNVIEAIYWAIDNRDRYNIRVMNLSLGRPVYELYLTDPLCIAVQQATDAKILVVAAAGNFGKDEQGRRIVGGVGAPGNCPAALTVGALNTRGTEVRSDDIMATYSSCGPTVIDGLLKPELVAPGNRIASTVNGGAVLAQQHPERVVSGHGANAYMELSGTSMAAAVVSGAAALLLEAKSSLQPADVKMLLQLTSTRVEGAGLIEAGAGSLNVLGAIGIAAGRTGRLS